MVLLRRLLWLLLVSALAQPDDKSLWGMQQEYRRQVHLLGGLSLLYPPQNATIYTQTHMT